MGWRIVRQPNGLLARFSENKDDFTCYHMTEKEALDLCKKRMGTYDAEEKVQAGIEDHEPWKHMIKGHGLSRWNECIEIIIGRHGYKHIQAELTEIKLAEYLPDASTFESNADNR